MANIIKDFLGYLKLSDEDEEYDEYMESFEQDEVLAAEQSRFADRKRKNDRTSRKTSDESMETMIQKSAVTRPFEERTSASRKERMTGMDKTANSKVVPLRKTTQGLEVCILKPSSFGDSQEICDVLLSGRAAVVNLEGFDPNEAQRIMDFVSGCVYAINGKLHQISNYIFIFSPDSVDISGDYLDLIPQEGFGVPTLNKEF